MRTLRCAASLALVLVLGLMNCRTGAQEFEFHAPASARDNRAAALMRDLAERVLPIYQENHPERYLANLAALQLVAGDYAAAEATRESLRERRQAAKGARVAGAPILYDIYVRARALEAKERVPFEQAFTQRYREVVSRLSDLDAYAVTGLPRVSMASLETALQDGFNQRRARGSISLADAVSLVWAFFSYDAYRRFNVLIDTLGAEDDRRRYLIDEKVVIRAEDGARISAVVVRPRTAAKPLAALLEFTIYADTRNLARECAAHGYAGVVAYARAGAKGPESIAPFEHDAADASAVVAWIARQPWSDGRVGMYGDGYSAYPPWAAAKHAPPALKAIATSDATAPGINFPMEGSIFQNTAYRWLSRVAGRRASAAGSDDDARWQALYRTWYLNGDACGDLDGLSGEPSAALHRWLDHPSYDRYWQELIPSSEQFARIDIPVLSISGYYADAEVGALYYFEQLERYHPRADQTLLLGPYEEGAVQREGPAALKSYPIDPVAAIDLRALRYEWFNFVLRGGAKPALLLDRVNYQVMGANAWRHVSSLAAMSDGSLRFYLDPAQSGDFHRLTRSKSADAAYLRQTVDLADRRDADWKAPSDIEGKSLAVRDGAAFVSEPLPQALELSGAFGGQLDFVANKMDMDVTISLYEQLPGGEYLQLFDPAYEFRASYVADRAHRRLLQAGARQQLDFRSERITSHLLPAGSRLVVVLGINKRPDQEVNYGTGGNVRDEYIEHAEVPLMIRWYGSSYIDIPIRKSVPDAASRGERTR